jgi:predicted DCC family thiol-disulfide oxidoreductase YuxK
MNQIENKKDVVLFDGHCNFCRSQIEILRRLDGGKRLVFLSLHDPSVKVDYPDLSYEQLMDQMWIVSRSGERFGGAYAVRYLTRLLPLLWPAAPLLHFPGLMPMWCFLYRQVAKYRYRLAGKNCDEGGTCSLHHSGRVASKPPAN